MLLLTSTGGVLNKGLIIREVSPSGGCLLLDECVNRLDTIREEELENK